MNFKSLALGLLLFTSVASTQCGPILGSIVYGLVKAVGTTVSVVVSIPNPLIPVGNPLLASQVLVATEAVATAAGTAATVAPTL